MMRNLAVHNSNTSLNLRRPKKRINDPRKRRSKDQASGTTIRTVNEYVGMIWCMNLKKLQASYLIVELKIIFMSHL
jgi:hypothetical protein